MVRLGQVRQCAAGTVCLGLEGPVGSGWPGSAGKAECGTVSLGESWLGPVRRGRQGMERHGEASPELGVARRGLAGWVRRGGPS